MNISTSTRQAYSEVDQILELISEEKRNEIPKKLRDFFKEEKDKTYEKRIDARIPIKDQNLKKETLAIFALLNMEYWCKDEEEKNRLKNIYSKNEKEYQEKISNNSNNGINNKEESEKDVQIVENKESFWKKLLNKIKDIFHIK